jgi:hypothetical protein
MLQNLPRLIWNISIAPATSDADPPSAIAEAKHPPEGR